MPSIAELGRRVKARHTEYADLSDQEVGQRVQSKFPDYADFSDSTATQTTRLPAPERSEVLASAGLPHLARTIGPLREFLPLAAGSLANVIPGLRPLAAAGRIGAASLLGMGGEAARLGLRGELPETAGAATRASLPGAWQGGLQALGEAPGLLSRAAGGIAERLAGRAERRAVDRFRAEQALKDISRETGQAVSQARGARQAAAGRTEQTIRAARGRGTEVTVGDVAQRLIARRNASLARLGRPLMDKREVGQLVAEVKARMRDVLPEYTGGVLRGRQNVYGIDEAQLAKQAFDRSARTVHGQQARGILPKPSLDQDISHAWRGLIEARVKGVRGLNRETQAALETERRLMRFAQAQPPPEVEALRQLRTERQLRFAARNPESTSDLMDVYSRLPGFPLRLLIRPGAGPGMLRSSRVLERLLGHPATRFGFQTAPRAATAASIYGRLEE